MKGAKITGIVFGVFLFIIFILGLTYAAIVWSSPKINKKVPSKCFDVLYEKGNDITGTIIPSLSYNDGLYSEVKLNMNSKCNINADGIIHLSTGNETSSNLFKNNLLNYAVVKGNTLIKNGVITGPGEIEVPIGRLERNSSAITKYKVYVWVNAEFVTNSDEGASYKGFISSEVIQTDNSLN